MFESLKKYSQIFVTGPQRSGTTIASKMIAADTGFKYVDEFKFGVCNQQIIRELIRTTSQNVIQCPGLCRHIHEIADDTMAVILMCRSIEDIIASQTRIDWKCEKMELMKYRQDERFNLSTIAEIKYKFWDDVQKSRIKNAIELQYEFISGHPLWVEKSLRQKFHAKQTNLADDGVRPMPQQLKDGPEMPTG